MCKSCWEEECAGQGCSTVWGEKAASCGNRTVSGEEPLRSIHLEYVSLLRSLNEHKVRVKSS